MRMTDSVAKPDVPKRKLIAIGILGGLVGIYLTYLNVVATDVTKTPITYFSFFGGIGAVLATYWGADAVRRVSKYGLGTGVPSIGMLALGMGLVASMFGLAIAGDVANKTGLEALGLLGPIISFVVAIGIGFIIGYLANNVIGINVPVMVGCTTEIAGSGALILVGLSAAVAGVFTFKDLAVGSVTIYGIQSSVIDTGFIAVLFIASALAILHPFNACLGPDETQYRTLRLAISTGAIAMILAGISSVARLEIAAIPTIVIGLAIWIIFFKKYYEAVKTDAATVVETGLIPETEV